MLTESQNKYPETAHELIVRASIQIFLADKDEPKPVGFGTGFILEHRKKYFVVSVRHVTDIGDLTTYLETNLPPVENTTPLQPIGGLCYFDLFRVTDSTSIKEFQDLLQNGKKMDVTFAEITHEIELRQPQIDFGAFVIPESHKVILDSRDIAEPDINKTYGFYGKIKPKYDGYYLRMENTFKHSLTFYQSESHFHIFQTPNIIMDEKDFAGCSGAPIIDSDGMLVGLACMVAVPSYRVYGFSIHECIKLLDIAIDTGLVGNNENSEPV